MKSEYKLFLFLIFLLGFSSIAVAQLDYSMLCEQSYNIQNKGMIILGSWAVINIGTGIYGWNKYSNQHKYFYQMNFFWNFVNLSIAGLALYNNSQINCAGLTPETILSDHKHTENILLINTALDVGYIGIGFLLKHYGSKNVERKNILNGYGNSLILQGSFLFVFDLILYGLLRNLRADLIPTISFNQINEINIINIAFNL